VRVGRKSVGHQAESGIESLGKQNPSASLRFKGSRALQHQNVEKNESQKNYLPKQQRNYLTRLRALDIGLGLIFCHRSASFSNCFTSNFSMLAHSFE
jgi:hypothetical protein